MIRPWNGKTPQVHDTAFVSELAYVVGEVEVGVECSIWPCVVVRADYGKISIGDDTHIQDGSVVHSYTPASIGNHVNIGHAAVIHAGRIDDHCIIGNNSTLLEDVEIGEYSLVGANAMVRQGAKIPPHSFVIGVPAEVRPLSKSQKEMLRNSTEGFAELARLYKRDGLE